MVASTLDSPKGLTGSLDPDTAGIVTGAGAPPIAGPSDFLRRCLTSWFPRNSTHYGAVRGIVHDDDPSADHDMIPDGNGPEDRRIGADSDVIPDAYLARLRSTPSA